MPKSSTSRIIGTFKNSVVSDVSFEFDCPLESDLKKIQRIFYTAFIKAYRGHKAAELKLPEEITKKAFLKNIFADEINAIRENKVHCVVAKINEQPVAAATFKLNPYTGNLYLSILAVSPQIQSKGIARQLLDVLEKRFNGLNGFDLYTRKFNQSAIGFYQRQHFQEKAPKSLSIKVNEESCTGFEKLFKRSQELPLQRSHSLPDLNQVAILKCGQ
jgi:GNAT superfamily N-acetyltransferase